MKMKALICSFWLIICFPIILAIIYIITNVKLDITLGGYYDTYEMPELTTDAYVEGTYQRDYEAWLNANLIPRGVCIKLYNQIEYSCFDLGNNIIGDHNNIFEHAYVADALALDEYNYASGDKQAELELYVERLERIRSKLKEYDKYLVIYTTPSKAVHCPEDIPVQYTIRQREDSIRAREYLMGLLSETDIPYLDVETLIPGHEYPLFYSTGIHWARPLEQEMSCAVVELLKDISGKNLRNIVLTSMKTSDVPYNRDADVYEVLNIFSPIKDITFYEYAVERECPDTYEKARILLQGGSFAQGLLFDYSDLYGNDEISYINYDNYMFDHYRSMQTLETWEDLDLGAYLDKVDFVVIELQDAVVKDYSSGFVAYLDEYLENYIPTKEESEYSANFDAVKETGMKNSKGYWGFEEGFSWAKPCSYVRLQNNTFAKDGVTMELTIPEYLLNDGPCELNVYVNCQKIDTRTVSVSGKLKLDYDAAFFSDNADVYEIEIYCDKSFFPKELGMDEEDPRELSLMIHYIGEKR